MMDAAGKMVEELGAPRYKDSVQCHWARLWYFQHSGNRSAARREWEELIRLKDYDSWTVEAWQLARTGDMSEAIKLAKGTRSKPMKATEPRVFAAIILAESDPRAARELYQEAAARRTGGISDLWPQGVLRLLGRRSEAEEASRALRARKPPWPWRGGWYEQLLAFYCGDISAQQLLERAGTSRMNRADANFAVGMRYLADGDRARAKEHFEAVVEPGFYWWYVHQLSDIFLARMKQDPAWPKWIGAKAGGATQPVGK